MTTFMTDAEALASLDPEAMNRLICAANEGLSIEEGADNEAEAIVLAILKRAKANGASFAMIPE